MDINLAQKGRFLADIQNLAKIGQKRCADQKLHLRHEIFTQGETHSIIFLAG